MRRMWLGLAATVGLAVSTGCGGQSPEDSEARLAVLEAEGKQMDQALDAVEDRLLGSQGRLAMWNELGRRHQEVSAIQCKVADAHMAAILKHEDKQNQKARMVKQRNSMASVDTAVLTSGKAPAQQRSN
ncbi:hypothetical protein D7X96_17660 [Corallococcus interemptor]|uniref:Lipoprotein n=2 Tax=Corallococcus interemptor TaxID=2316720 RepID=A0A3A8QN85_9BACT|nr:hypothetical protein D7Y23_23930 [Corallococcus sp. AB050B]RKH68340.1 hypothetical protein D7X96_17660 [Corallococcus interemptor]